MTKNSILTKLAAQIERVAKASAGQSCVMTWHQPKVPASLKQTKSK